MRRTEDGKLTPEYWTHWNQTGKDWFNVVFGFIAIGWFLLETKYEFVMFLLVWWLWNIFNLSELMVILITMLGESCRNIWRQISK